MLYIEGERMKEIENKIGYIFYDKALLVNALTHSSYANEHHTNSNERLEFLGDSVLSIIISEYLYKTMKRLSEGDLSKIRASLVCEQSLNNVARKMNLQDGILLGNGEEAMGGRDRASIVSDAFEALLGAIYLDGGLKKASQWLLKIMQNDIELAVNGQKTDDYKSELQEKVQKQHMGTIIYKLIREEGQAHMKIFTVNAVLNDKVIGVGSGTSKKEAEQRAAKVALRNIK